MTDDMDVYTSPADFTEALAKQQEAQHRGLHPLQLGVGHGDHWVRFVDLDAHVIEFGRCWTLDEVRDDERASGFGARATDRMVKSVESSLANQDLLYGSKFSRLDPSGYVGHMHRSHVWPIEERLFNMAMGVDFDYRKFDEVPRFLLDVAFKSMRAHVVGR